MTEAELEFPPAAPDVAIEVLSPGHDRSYLERKLQLYLSHGTVAALEVDPLERTIVVRDRDGSWSFRVGDTFEHRAVPWLRFDVAEAFADLDIPETK